ncbi:hypothetical protein S122051_2522 [Staphylococcus aureus subsp. aureus 122051]|nr:hypothetical protein S122051_2522 [Staphylococcus aureus subsp. aureus 122051]
MLLMTKFLFIFKLLYNLRYIATLVLKQFDYLSIFSAMNFFNLWCEVDAISISIVIIFHI